MNVQRIMFYDPKFKEDQIKTIEKTKEENDKEIDKFIKDSEKAIDEINKGKFEILKESIDLDEPLNEDESEDDILSDYEPESEEAQETLDTIEENGKLDAFKDFLKETFPEGLTNQQIEDLLVYEKESILDIINMEEE